MTLKEEDDVAIAERFEAAASGQMNAGSVRAESARATASSSASGRSRVGRWAAIPAAFGAIVHVWALFNHDHGVVLGSVMAAMALLCAWCAVETWVAPSTRGLWMLLAMSWAMIGIHIVLLLGLGTFGAGHVHDHGAATAVSGGAMSAFDAGMLAIIACEFLVATCCVIALRARRMTRTK